MFIEKRDERNGYSYLENCLPWVHDMLYELYLPTQYISFKITKLIFTCGTIGCAAATFIEFAVIENLHIMCQFPYV